MKPTKVCFISLRSYPLFTKKSSDYFGGAEVQMSLIAKALAKDKKFQVSVIVGDYGQKAAVKRNRLTLYRAFKHGRFFPFEVIRFFRLLKKINAEIYIERTMNIKVGLVALLCRMFGKKFIYMIAHDWDCQKDFGRYLTGLSRLSFAFGLKQTDLIIAQTRDQQKQLLKNWKRPSFLLPSIFPQRRTINQKTNRPNYILWIGRAEKWKRPEKFLKLVSRFPQQKFVMICRQVNNQYYFQQLFTQLQPLPNLEFFSEIPFSQINKFFQQAKILVNTSLAEGFPNTFLQAGLNRVPILSLTINPDRFITRYQCGLVADNNINKLVNNCQKLLHHPRLAYSLGKHNFHYVTTFHHPKLVFNLKQRLQDWDPVSIFSPGNK